MSVTQRRILLFFVVAYAFTWFGILGNALWPSDYWLQPMNPFGPLIAAPLVIWLTEGGAGLKAWLRRIARFRAPVWVYGAACLIPLAIIFGSIASASALGAVLKPIPQVGIVDFIVMIPVILLAGPLPEEVTFRGHAQHQLQQEMSPLAVALLIGVGVLVWHTPLLVSGHLAWPWAITIVLVSIVYAWLYNSGGSIWPVVLLHFTVNYFGSEFLGEVVSEPATQMIYAMVFCAAYAVWALAIVWKAGPSLGRDRQGNVVPTPAYSH
jgi:membrane protease YdiL (CAAX protease family)